MEVKSQYRGFDIGDVHIENPLILAPMAGVTDLPFRLLCKEKGCALVYTEMVSAKGLFITIKIQAYLWRHARMSVRLAFSFLAQTRKLWQRWQNA